MAIDVVSATDVILSDLKVLWDVQAAVLVTPTPVLVFEPLEKSLLPHPADAALPWARVVVQHVTGRAAAIGPHRWRRTGLVLVNVFVPFTDGSSFTLAQRLAKIAQEAYETPADTRVKYPRVDYKERGRDGTFYRVDVVANFWWDEIK